MREKGRRLLRIHSFLPHLSAALTSSPAGGGTDPSVTTASGGDTSPCGGRLLCCPLPPQGRPSAVSFIIPSIRRPGDPLRGNLIRRFAPPSPCAGKAMGGQQKTRRLGSRRVLCFVSSEDLRIGKISVSGHALSGAWTVPDHTTPWASMASAIFRKPATLAPSIRSPGLPHSTEAS